MNPPTTAVSQLDRIGFWASTICAIHCGAVPLLLTVLPLLGLEYLTDPRLEWSMIAMSAAIALSSLISGYRKQHKRFTALVVFGCGIVTILVSRLLAANELEHILGPIGATGIAASHAINYRLCKWCRFCR